MCNFNELGVYIFLFYFIDVLNVFDGGVCCVLGEKGIVGIWVIYF